MLHAKRAVEFWYRKEDGSKIQNQKERRRNKEETKKDDARVGESKAVYAYVAQLCAQHN